MTSISQFIPLVKDQIAFQLKMAEKYAHEPWRQNKHTVSSQKFQELLIEIERVAPYIEEFEKLQNIKHILKQNMNLSFKEIQGLPEELIKELSISDADRMEFTLQGIIEENGGIASLDRLLVELYRKTGEICKRAAITARLYRMVQKGLVFSVPNKKGVYSIQEIEEEDVHEEDSQLVNL